jgi:hypothetical protein
MSPIRNRARWIAVVAASLALTACDVKQELLEPQNPGLIDPGQVDNADAADALRIGALGSLKSQMGGGETMWMFGGLLTDEWKSADTFLQRNETDQRVVQTNNGTFQGTYNGIQQTRGYIRDGIEQMTKYLPTRTTDIGELFFALGVVEMQMAETLCNGIPLGLSRGGVIDYTDPSYVPLTNADVYTRAVAHFDSALTLIGAQTDAKSISVRQATLVAKARTLLDLNHPAEAAALVPTSDVPTSYQYLLTFAQTSGDNGIWSLNTNQGRYTVSDSFDITGVIPNALPFISAKDPRVPVTDAKKKGFDGQTNLFTFGVARGDPLALVSGIDARLIEAEAKYVAGDIPGMMTVLNALRTSAQKIGNLNVPAMPELAAPADSADALQLLFRERAFWTFGRGQRLGNLRRLIRQYKLTQEEVFPQGTFFKNGTYGTDVNMPVTDGEKTNPNFHGCIDRNA